MLTFKRAKWLFRYDATSGQLFWRNKPAPRANRIKVGDEVGNLCRGSGGKTLYRQTSVDKEKYQLHRIIWLLHYGSFPEHEIDHEDGNGLNNRIANLRDVTGAVQRLNLPIRSDNKSGHCGVSWHRKARKWIVQIQHRSANRYIGLYKTVPDAVEAYKRAAEKLGFHRNHGRTHLRSASASS